MWTARRLTSLKNLPENWKVDRYHITASVCIELKIVNKNLTVNVSPLVSVNLQKKTFLRFYSNSSQRTFPSFVKGYISPKISAKILNSHHKLKWQTDNKPSWPSIMVIQRHPTASNKKRREPTETVRSHCLTPLSAYIDKFRVQSLAHNSHLNFIPLSLFLSLAKIFSKSQVSAFSLTLEI